MFTFGKLAVAASLAAAVAADHGHSLHARSHHQVGRSNLQKRYSGTATYYAVGMGACGQNNVASDFIVALNSDQFGSGYPGPNCFKPITICAKGKCVGATIMDECPTCGSGSLDLSEGLFKQFASTDDGVFQMTWTFNGDGGGDSKPTSTKKPDPTTTKKPEPTTTWTPEPTTTWEAPTTTSSKSKTTTSSPPPETTSTHESTTSSTSSTPTTTSTVAPTTSSSSSSSTSVATSTSAAGTGTSAAPSASASSTSTTGSGSNNGSGSGSNLVDAQQVMLAFGRLVTAAN
ncbi:hypothetical protein FRC11_007167 [Ceratobasidium sp. 423]|nr:hypothetical protein FRC11_007167 [Ceratobasidium sp. 423]